MRPVDVVPAHIECELALQGRQRQRHEHQPSGAFILQAAIHPLDDRQAAMRVDGAEALTDATPSAPAPERLRGELLSVIREPRSRPSNSLDRYTPSGSWFPPRRSSSRRTPRVRIVPTRRKVVRPIRGRSRSIPFDRRAQSFRCRRRTRRSGLSCAGSGCAG